MSRRDEVGRETLASGPRIPALAGHQGGAAGAAGQGDARVTGSRRRRIVLAGAGVVVVAVGAVACTRGDDDAGGCLSGLARHLPADLSVVSGTDLDQARAAGLAVDGPSGQLSDVVLQTDLQIDPLTADRVSHLEDSTERVGFGVEEMRCWVGEVATSPLRFLARGSFDGDALGAGDAGAAGDVAARGDLLAFDDDGDPRLLVDSASAAQAPLVALIESLERRGAITFAGMTAGATGEAAAGNEVWAALGLAHGDGWELLAVWGFASDAEAAAGRDQLLDAIERGEVAGMIEGDAEDLLQQDGPSLWLRAPLVGDTASWAGPMTVLDPIFTAFADWAEAD